jgi:hypothetical protein
VIIRHPIHQIRRHQHRLFPVTSNEVLSHPGIFITRPDDTTLPDSHGEKERCDPHGTCPAFASADRFVFRLVLRETRQDGD